MAPDYNTISPMTPTQSRPFTSFHVSRKSDDVIPRIAESGRSHSNTSIQYGARGSSLASSAMIGPAPGTFSSDLKNTSLPRSGTPRLELAISRTTTNGPDDDDDLTTQSEQRQAAVRNKIAKEMKIKLGTENLLEALQSKNAKQTKDQRQRVELELGTSRRKLEELHHQLNQEIKRGQTPTTPPRIWTTSYLRGSPLKSPQKPLPMNLKACRPLWS
jgi:rapamycin-insensitive companion of mTOR